MGNKYIDIPTHPGYKTAIKATCEFFSQVQNEGAPDYISNIQPLCRNCNSKKWKHIYENPELLNQSK